MRPYHLEVPSPVILALALVIGLLVLIPARRLQAAGFSGGAIGTYVVILWALGMAAAVQPIASRFLVPILIIAYLAPFVAAPEAVRRIVGRGGRRDARQRPMKNVTPPEVDGPADPPGSTR
jgi:hypothetical protein